MTRRSPSPRPGSLPSGVTLATDGTLSGTPGSGTAGSYPITITATDANSNTSTQDFTLTVAASGPVFTSAASTTFAENTAGTFAVTATGDTPITFTETGALPSGVTLATDGTLSGTPAAGTAGSYPITITATDANSNTATQNFTLTVTASGRCSPRRASTTFAESTAGTFAVTATGDTPITFTETGHPALGGHPGHRRHPVGHAGCGHGGQLPDHHHGDRRQLEHDDPVLHPDGDGRGPVFTSAASTTFAEGTAGTFAVTATGDTPITFTETGALPSGVTLAASGTLSGTPAAGTAGSYPITITATDANSNTATQNFTLTVAATGPVFTSAASTTFAENTAGHLRGHGDRRHADHLHRDRRPALGGHPGLRRHPVGHAGLRDGGQLPDHHHGDRRQLEHRDPELHPDGDGERRRCSPRRTSTTFAENTAGTFAVTATGDTPITFTETGALPSGVTLTTGGTLSGTPAFGTAGSYPITITATDAHSTTATQSFTLTVTATGPVFTSAASTTFAENTPGTFAVTATGDTPITFTETGSPAVGGHPATGGTLSGTPAAGTAGSYPITITATDANSNTTTQAFTLTVRHGSEHHGSSCRRRASDLPGNDLPGRSARHHRAGVTTVQFVITGGVVHQDGDRLRRRRRRLRLVLLRGTRRPCPTAVTACRAWSPTTRVRPPTARRSPSPSTTRRPTTSVTRAGSGRGAEGHQCRPRRHAHPTTSPSRACSS